MFTTTPREEGKALATTITRLTEGTTAVDGTSIYDFHDTGCPRLPFKMRWKIPGCYLLFLLFFNVAVPVVVWFLLKYGELLASRATRRRH